MDPPSIPTFNEREVMLTNHSATEQKLHAIRCGYFEDEFAQKIARLPDASGGSPLMRRGYYARVKFVEKAIRIFESKFKEYQIVSLGAGFDSSYFRMADKKQITGCVRWVDVDFPKVINEKNKNISQSRDVFEPLITNRYKTIGVDLRDPELGTQLQAAIIPDKPVLVLSECVLIYLPPDEGDHVIKTVLELFSGPVGFITYEQINPDDKFGTMMIKNLNARGCSLFSIHKYPSLISQQDRYKRIGFTQSIAKSMNTIWNTLSNDEIQHANKTEMLDEIEEWNLIHNHYMFACSEFRMDGWVNAVLTKSK